MLRAGARLIALQKNLFWFDREGERLDCGAFIVGLEAAARVQALVMGKPSAVFFESALRTLDTCAERALVIGDDVLTDCAGAKSIGASSVLVRTGKYELSLLEAHRHNVDYVIDSIADFPRWWRSINASDHHAQA
ncbi:HAD hydrolase-like protein [Pseudomonas syringae]|nr:HAD hydrolase-like protein [Pseudomonas syringae]OSN66945.1 Sugar-phosphatase AraL [Pseudomonas syringae pv. actinidiae]OSN77634.1 Sugar-phosphatase AraL [Pseudomonas syringae pv. actinidiae]RMR97772.1 hypothetical protein ALP75_203187 [Pseudomonas syringae pv. actinidiae]